MEKRYIGSVIERLCHWKAVVLLLALLFVTGLSHVHWNIYKSRVPDLVKVVVRGEKAFIMRACDGSGRVIGDVSYTDVGKEQNLYYWIPRTKLTQEVRLSAVGTDRVWIDGTEYSAENVGDVKPKKVSGISEGPIFCSFVGFWIFYFTAAVVLGCSLWSLQGLWSERKSLRSGSMLWWNLALLAVVGFRLFLGGARGIVEHPYDPTHYLFLAQKIAFGHWLGDYSPITLVKSVLYPVLMAGVMWLNLPYYFVLDCCFIAICWCMARAIRPLLGELMARIFFVAIIFAPLQIACQGVIVQEALALAMSLFVAAFIALWLRVDRPIRQLIPWYMLLGTGFCLMEFMREEHEFFELAWIGLFALYWGRLYLGKHSDRRCKCCLFVVVPLAVCFLYDFPTSAKTFRRYGFWGTCERRNDEYKKALGTLLGIGKEMDENYDFRIPLRKETLQKIAGLSTTCAEFANRLLDPQISAIGNVEQRPEDVSACPELLENIKCGWIQWEFRNAASSHGHYANWFEAREWYRRVARDLGNAIADGRIKGVGLRSASNPPVDASVMLMFLRKIPDLIGKLFLLQDPLHIDLELANNWKPVEEIEISVEDRWNYRSLMGADVWPTHSMRIQGWASDSDNQPLKLQDYAFPYYDIIRYARPDVNKGLNVPLVTNGVACLYGYSVMVNAGDDICVRCEGRELFKSSVQDVGIGNAYFHVDKIEDVGASPNMKKRKLLSTFLSCMGWLAPLMLVSFVISFLILLIALLRRRNLESIDSVVLPAVGFAIGFGYFLVIVLAHVYLQCQYGVIIIYLIPSVTLYWVSGCLAIALAVSRFKARPEGIHE